MTHNKERKISSDSSKSKNVETASLTPDDICGPSTPTSLKSNKSFTLHMNDELVSDYLDRHPYLVEKWIQSRATDENGIELILLNKSDHLRGREKKKHKRPSVGLSGSGSGSSSPSPDSKQRLSLNYSCSTRSNSICSWKSPKNRSRNGTAVSKKVEQLSEPELFMELIRDISTELDIDTLCHKILVNVGHLTHADRASLFLAQGPKQNRYLVAKLFDVTADSGLEQSLSNAKEKEILLPWGVGIVGHVASTKEIINIKDAYKDPRFDASVDQLTGYRTISVLCMPVCNFEGEVIGVAEIINKKNGTNEFTPQDVEVFRRYLTFCGIGIQNAQLFDMSMREYKRNQMLLQLAKGIFEEQTSLDRLVTKIMTDATDILKCERCAVYLLDLQTAAGKDERGSKSLIALEGKRESIESEEGIELQVLKGKGKSKSFSLDLDDCEAILDTRQCDVPSPTHILNYKVSKKRNFHTAFELRASKGESKILRLTQSQLSTSPHAALASYVSCVGMTINISDVQGWMGAPLETEGLLTFSVLTIPIFNSAKQIVGVAQMINKENGMHFSDYDINTFEAFATFCGLGIQNTQVYEKACRLMARQKVALECLSYHATASREDTDMLKIAEIPSSQDFNLYSYDFSDFGLSDIDTCKCVLRMFMDLELIEKFSINYEVMCRWTLSVKKNYRPVKYHNWRHALNVCQTMFAILKTGKIEKFMTDLEMLGLLVACLSHDLDHRGTNNSFQTKTDSPLAILYSTSTMEHHHFDQCVMILSQDSNNIFQSLSATDYRKVMQVVENAILSTDMGLYFKKKNTFLELSDNGEFDWQSPDKKELLCGMMMTACDVSAIAKPWEVQHKIAKLVADEFFEQGDLEKLKLNQEPMAMMDREKKDELPKMQVGFINFICLPLYKALSESFPWVKPLYDGCKRNQENWQRLSEQVDMGLTWIDHEYIEKPVERNETQVVSKIKLNPKVTPNEVTMFDNSQTGVTTVAKGKSRSLSCAFITKNLRSVSKQRSMDKKMDRAVNSFSESKLSKLSKTDSQDTHTTLVSDGISEKEYHKSRNKYCSLL
ncbi:UNVERIFIED_CONTAM: hypothetical protein RMT77_010773 [Armadillidium vulgare]